MPLPVKYQDIQVFFVPCGLRKESSVEHREFKNSAKRVADYLTEQGFSVPHTRILEALARGFGERNWGALQANLRAESKAKSLPPSRDWTPNAGVMPEQEYVARAGASCPVCGGTDLEAHSLEADGPTAWDQCECNDCGASWKSAYSLSGYYELEPGEARAPEALSADEVDASQALVLVLEASGGESCQAQVYSLKAALSSLWRHRASLCPDVAEPNLRTLVSRAEHHAEEAVKLLAQDAVPVLHVSGVSASKTSALESCAFVLRANGMQRYEGLREALIEDIVDDVRQRARDYGFSIAGGRQAERLARESAEVLGLDDMTEDELFEAACRLA